MCRLFGFRSVLFSGVHSSLVGADNALMVQSARHPDGWGVAYYNANAPHLVKSVSTAVDDQLFKRVSGLVASQTVVAHLRKATEGELSILNTHPFQFGKWVFAHNGHITKFTSVRDELIAKLNDQFKPYLFGDTDSELLFLLLLSELRKVGDLSDHHFTQTELFESVQRFIKSIVDSVGDFAHESGNDLTKNYFTFILTNGKSMIAHQGGQRLFYSTHKSRCSERDTCPSFAPICEAKAKNDDQVNHLIFSSEPLSGENEWFEMNRGQIVAVDEQMSLKMT